MGCRIAIAIEDKGATLWSRQGKDLTKYFPELASAAIEQIPAGCVVDGEALIWSNDRLDFNSLQQRMITGKAALPGFVKERPASFAAFDVLAVAGHDTRNIMLRDRRTLLEELASGWSPPLNLSPTTADFELATQWFEEMPATGIEGLVCNSLLN
ncbi:hypothetical protein GCM10023063_15690 [Arthrobacter methylotrophus]|uniref:ATP-dependent DNA ligase family profile domain-containing protein n=1 Tax=Arthrobacter methylotrophus TaxID=121291 RepID=A0ABV5UN95_9MICC